VRHAEVPDTRSHGRESCRQDDERRPEKVRPNRIDGEVNEYDKHAREKQGRRDMPCDSVELLVSLGAFEEEVPLEAEALGAIVIDELVERRAAGISRIHRWRARYILDLDPPSQVAR